MAKDSPQIINFDDLNFLNPKDRDTFLQYWKNDDLVGSPKEFLKIISTRKNYYNNLLLKGYTHNQAMERIMSKKKESNTTSVKRHIDNTIGTFHYENFKFYLPSQDTPYKNAVLNGLYNPVTGIIKRNTINVY